MRFAGIDIGSEEHVVAVLDERNEVIVKATTFTEDAAGYGEATEGRAPRLDAKAHHRDLQRGQAS